MSAVLSDAQVEQVGRDGHVSPVPVLDAREANEFRRRLEAVEQRQGGALEPAQRRHRPSGGQSANARSVASR